MSEFKPNMLVSAIGHDPEGKWAPHFSTVNERIDEIYGQKIISFTTRTSEASIKAAEANDWQVFVEETSIGVGRFKAIERGLNGETSFINLWEGDRLLHAATVAPSELMDFTQAILNYDFFILGATIEGIKTHPSSMTSWESIKSWWLGHYLGFEGDIANRGSFGFSREFATFLLTYQLSEGDETDGLIPIMALAYQKLLTGEGKIGRGIGYAEYPNIASFEDWIFEGLTQEESARRKTSLNDFFRRGAHVSRILKTADDVALMYGLTSPDQTFDNNIRRFL